MMKTVFAALAVVGVVTVQSDYSGLWYRVDSRSDDPQPKIEAAVRGLVEKVTRGRRSSEDIDPQALRQMQRVVDAFVQYAEELDIEQSSKDLVVDDGGPRLRIFYLDGKKHERQMHDGTRLETTATIIGSQIDVYQKTSEGAKIYERYSLSSDGSEMSLTVRLEDKQLKQPLVIRNVYKRAD